MSHKPRRLVRHAQHAVKLMGAHSLLGRTEKMNSQQPFVLGNVAILKDRVHGHGELLLTVLALVHSRTNRLFAVRLRRQLVGRRATAMRAYRTIGPAQVLKELTGLLCVLEVRCLG